MAGSALGFGTTCGLLERLSNQNFFDLNMISSTIQA
jgi:hypothetical protein